jgi:putative intracellular protease/amidase
LTGSQSHPEGEISKLQTERRTMKVLIVLTSHDRLGETREKTGFWLEEFAAPYYVFKDGGAEITLASPKGGQPPVDARSEAEDFQTEATRRFNADESAKDLLSRTLKLSSVRPGDFDVIFYPGGHGPVWDLAEDRDSIALLEAMTIANKPVGAVCHGVAVLRHAKLNGVPLVRGRTVTSFTNTEEEAVGMTKVVPYLVEDMLKGNGARYVRGEDWAPFVTSDGNLVTGQNPASSRGVAEQLLKLVEGSKG